MATLCDLASRIPNAVIVVSCLEDFYKTLSESLARPLVDRIEKDPAPIRLKGTREEDEVVTIVAQRLRSLFDARSRDIFQSAWQTLQKENSTGAASA